MGFNAGWEGYTRRNLVGVTLGCFFFCTFGFFCNAMNNFKNMDPHTKDMHLAQFIIKDFSETAHENLVGEKWLQWQPRREREAKRKAAEE
mmetsp:Transcript_15795/g.23114  ORF Transcript_15795/g.23114 Transcript_15795/m.23114 type:complete len:90 (-) Transcript_15795:186-455(-)